MITPLKVDDHWHHFRTKIPDLAAGTDVHYFFLGRCISSLVISGHVIDFITQLQTSPGTYFTPGLSF